MKERNLVGRCGAALGLLGALFAACGKEPDLPRATVRELFDLVEIDRSKGQPEIHLFHPVQEELLRRPWAEWEPELQRLAADPAPSRRRLVAELLGAQLRELRHGPNPARRQLRGRLLAMLDDADEEVRAMVLVQWCHAGALQEDVPEPVLAALRALLLSPDERSRWTAAFSGFLLGWRTAPLAPLLADAIAAAKGGARFMLVLALGFTRAADERTVASLVELLDDDEANVRMAAAAGLEKIGPPAAAGVPRLRAIVAKADEDADTRCAAATALARIVTTQPDAEAVLRDLLGVGSVYGKHVQGTRLADLGQLACVAPHGEPAAAASKVLRQAANAEDEDLALVAIACLCRIAAARGEPFDADQLARLRAAIPDIAGLAKLAPMAAAHYSHVVEALVDLARWPLSGVDRGQIAAVLDRVAESTAWWLHDWAIEQRAKLPWTAVPVRIRGLR